MKRKPLCAVLLLALALSLPACSGSGTTRREGEGPLVYTSIYPIYDFTVKVAGDRAQVESIMSTGSDAHDWEPTTKDLRRLEEADLFVYNGAGMEGWTDRLLRSVPEDLFVLDTSEALSLLPADHSDHDHDHGDEDGHHHGESDPHLWLSLRNAQGQMAAIRDALCEIDPGGAAVYQANYRHWAGEFAALDREYQDMVESSSRDVIVVAHKAYGYLCRDYGLTQVSARGFSPDQEPDTQSMAAVIDFCRAHDIPVIFFEDEADPRVAETIARDVGVSTAVLYPVEKLTPEQLAGGEDYLSLMRYNLETLRNALQ